jgi:hypothetical protein
MYRRTLVLGLLTLPYLKPCHAAGKGRPSGVSPPNHRRFFAPVAGRQTGTPAGDKYNIPRPPL